MKMILSLIGVTLLAIIIVLGMLIFNIFGVRDDLLNTLNPINSIDFDSSIEVRPDVDSNPLLNEEYEGALESIGIDPADLPSEITPEMIDCAKDTLGVERVQELMDGATPSFTDFMNAQTCLE